MWLAQAESCRFGTRCCRHPLGLSSSSAPIGRGSISGELHRGYPFRFPLTWGRRGSRFDGTSSWYSWVLRHKMSFRFVGSSLILQSRVCPPKRAPHRGHQGFSSTGSTLLPPDTALCRAGRAPSALVRHDRPDETSRFSCHGYRCLVWATSVARCWAFQAWVITSAGCPSCRFFKPSPTTGAYW